jgi:hypothetical protein
VAAGFGGGAGAGTAAGAGAVATAGDDEGADAAAGAAGLGVDGAGGGAVTAGVATGSVVAGATVAVRGWPELPRKNIVASTAALTPSTAMSSQTHQGELPEKNVGRLTTRGAATPRAFSLSARLRAS